MSERKIKYLLYTKNPQEFTVDEFLNRGAVGAGWNDLLREMFERMFALGWNGELLQVKEKFGGLRVHLGQNPDGQHINDLVWDLTNEYERRSLIICERCGGFPAGWRGGGAGKGGRDRPRSGPWRRGRTGGGRRPARPIRECPIKCSLGYTYRKS